MDIKTNLQHYLEKIDIVIKNGYYKDTWESLGDHKVPDWYKNAKFGIFIHWGVYTVPEFGNEWYPRHMYRKGKYTYYQRDYYNYHQTHFGKLKDFGYKDFVPMFKAEKFDAKEWALLFKQAGAKFVMPVAEHHDGFQMYDSELSEWCATKMGPKRDILQELKNNIEEQGMVFTTSSHRAEHYWFLCGGRTCESDFPKEIPYGHIYWPSIPGVDTLNNKSIFEIGIKDIDPLFLNDFLARTCEIIDKYHPKLLYFDGGISNKEMKPYLKKIAAYYYNRALEWGEEVTINCKDNAFMYGTAVYDFERGQLSGISPRYWQNDTSVANKSWSYAPDNDYKKPVSIIRDMIDVVSKNGSFLLNIGPRADGTIPQEDREILLSIGEWLTINGEGIYNTSTWRTFGEGPTLIPEGHMTDLLERKFTSEDLRFTYKSGILYVFCLQWPEDSIVKIKSLSSGRNEVVVKKISILGFQDQVPYRQTNQGLTIIANPISTKNPVCIKIEMD